MHYFDKEISGMRCEIYQMRAGPTIKSIRNNK